MLGRLIPWCSLMILLCACGKVSVKSADASLTDDGGGGADADPSAPVIETIDIGPGIVDVGQSISLTCIASDPEDDPITYEWTTTLGEVVGAGESIELDARFTDGEAMVTCTATDDTGKSDSLTEAVTISLPREGVVAYYPFDGNGNDASGNAHNITVGDTASFVTNRLGTPSGALRVDGTVVLTLPDESAFDLTSYTVALFVTTEDTSMNRAILGKGANFGNYTMRILMTTQRGEYVHQTVTGGNHSHPLTNVALGTSFAHVAVTFDGNLLTTYIDGAVVASAAAPPPALNNAAVTLGGAPALPSWIGALDEARFYSRPLSAEEIMAIASSSVH